MRGALATIGSIGVICLAGLRLCARVGDDVVSLARAGRSASSLSHVDDLASSRALWATQSLDDGLRGYSIRRGADNLLDVVDAAGNTYEAYSPEEKERFWTDSAAYASRNDFIEMQEYLLYKKLTEKSVVSLDHPTLKTWAKAELLFAEVSEPWKGKLSLTNEIQMVMALHKELKRDESLVEQGDTSYVHRVFTNYLALRHKALLEPGGEEKMRKFDNIFLVTNPFVSLEQSYERALSECHLLDSAINH